MSLSFPRPPFHSCVTGAAAGAAGNRTASLKAGMSRQTSGLAGWLCVRASPANRGSARGSLQCRQQEVIYVRFRGAQVRMLQPPENPGSADPQAPPCARTFGVRFFEERMREDQDPRARAASCRP
ncbi:unnamed protein product [Rangifer tarandus platyrhynchus]|uniref:Uncharacterized protein n=1 Tax=Rangifer tarandus platyrhynchus TaxID=3082113 RepID=A0ABN8ZVW9_RANTA|nr:unnamed protein product [Rangifer tarandus platyrhynchus]